MAVLALGMASPGFVVNVVVIMERDRHDSNHDGNGVGGNISHSGDDSNIDFQDQDDQPENSLLGGEVHLDGRVAPGVVDLPGVDLLDGHPGG